VLIDETGNTRALLHADKDGSGLFLSDENGLVRTGLGATGLALVDKNGEVRAGLGMDVDGPKLELYENGKTGASLGVPTATQEDDER
jgi:hypothetical protein